MSEMVCLSGSLSIRSLDSALRIKIRELAQQGASFLVGDAPGADSLFQTELQNLSVKKVLVYYAQSLRNNLGNWQTIEIESGLTSKGKDAYTARDRVMCSRASVGVVCWDGISAGSFANVMDLVQQGKAVELFLREDHLHLNSPGDLEQLRSFSPAFEEVFLEAQRRISRYHRRVERKAFTNREEPLF
jgi:hypothetical protein